MRLRQPTPLLSDFLQIMHDRARAAVHVRPHTFLALELLILVLLAASCVSGATVGGSLQEAPPVATATVQATGIANSTETVPPAGPTPTDTRQPTPASDRTPTAPPPTLTAEEAQAIARLSPQDQEAVRYADWLEKTTDHWVTEVMVPATRELNPALMRKDYDAFCRATVPDAMPLKVELAARPAPLPLKDAYGYATVLLERWQSYREGIKSFCRSRDTKDLAAPGQAISQAGIAFQQLRSALQTFYDELSVRIGLTPAPAGRQGTPSIVTPRVPDNQTPDPNAVPTMSAGTRTIFLRAGADRLDRQMSEWMDRIARPRLAELQDALDRGDFGAACQVTIVDVGSTLLGMTPPITGLEALQPTDEAAREVLTSWQELRDSMRTLCRATTAEQKATVLRWMDSVESAYERFQSELKLLRRFLETQ